MDHAAPTDADEFKKLVYRIDDLSVLPVLEVALATHIPLVGHHVSPSMVRQLPAGMGRDVVLDMSQNPPIGGRPDSGFRELLHVPTPDAPRPFGGDGSRVDAELDMG